MKYLSFFFILGLLLLIALPLWGQSKLSKKEKKALKKELKEYYYDIEKFEDMKRKNSEKQASIDSLRELVQRGNSNKAALDESLKDLQSEQAKLNAEISAVKARIDSINRAKQEKVNVVLGVPKSGTVFSVQIGAYNQSQFSHLLQQQYGGKLIEVEENSMKKYLLGFYDSYEEAQQHRDNVRQLGIRQAWVVIYRDGQRIAIEEVMEEIVE